MNFLYTIYNKKEHIKLSLFSRNQLKITYHRSTIKTFKNSREGKTKTTKNKNLYSKSKKKCIRSKDLKTKIVLHQITRTRTPKNYFTHKTQSINI